MNGRAFTVLMLVAAIVCFAASWAVAYGWQLGNSNWQEWIAGGLAAFTAAHLP